MLPEPWRNVRRLLLIRLDNVGDVVMLGPALRTLRTALRQAHLTLMATPAGTQVAPMLPWLDEVLTYSVFWQDISGKMAQDPQRELAIAAELRRRNFDAALIFTSFSQSPYPPAFVCYLAGIPLRTGQSREFGGGLLTHWVKPLPDDTHQAERNLWLLEQAGFTIADRSLELHIPAGDQRRADRLLREVGIGAQEPFIALAPGASAAARRYDAQRFAESARLLAGETGLPVVLLGSARETDLAETILAGAGEQRMVSLVGRTSLVEMAGVIRRTSLLIGNNSGPLHVADAFRRPMVILYSGTDYENQWRPRSAPNRLLRRPTDCSPCYGFQCPYRMECLDIPPQDVVTNALALLNDTLGSRRSLARVA